jgi:hypothetical protein
MEYGLPPPRRVKSRRDREMAKNKSIPWQKRRRRLIQVVTGTFPCGQQMLKYGYKRTAACTLCQKAHEESGQTSPHRPRLVAHVPQYPPPPHAHSFVLGPAVINTHTRYNPVLNICAHENCQQLCTLQLLFSCIFLMFFQRKQ